MKAAGRACYHWSYIVFSSSSQLPGGAHRGIPTPYPVYYGKARRTSPCWWYMHQRKHSRSAFLCSLLCGSYLCVCAPVQQVQSERDAEETARFPVEVPRPGVDAIFRGSFRWVMFLYFRPLDVNRYKAKR